MRNWCLRPLFRSHSQPLCVCVCLLPCLVFRSLRTRNAVFSTAAAKIFNQFQFLFRETISYVFFSFVNVVVIINLRRGSLKPILADTTFFGFIKNQQQQQRTATTSTTATTTATTKKAHSHKLLGSKTHTHQRRKKTATRQTKERIHVAHKKMIHMHNIW